MSSKGKLEDLRGAIARVDDALAQIIGRRLETARKVGVVKAAIGRPMRDFAVERIVVSRFQERLARAGVASSRAAALAEWLIEESVRAQESTPRVAPPAKRRKRAEVVVVGGSGGMGRWLAEFLEEARHRVAVVDPRADPRDRPVLDDVETAARTANVVAFATPIRVTPPLLSRALAAGSNPLIFDILSVKAPIQETLRSAAREGRNVTSLHPMFGPSARTLSGRNLLVVSCGNPAADRLARSLFEHSALTISELPLDRHDAVIAKSLGLSHAVNLLFLAALATENVDRAELAQGASTTFHRQSALAHAVASEGPELYLDIQALNPHSQRIYDDLRSALDRLNQIVSQDDYRRFRELLGEGATRLEPGSAPMRE